VYSTAFKHVKRIGNMLPHFIGSYERFRVEILLGV
jgi:hypothetical protein